MARGHEMGASLSRTAILSVLVFVACVFASADTSAGRDLGDAGRLRSKYERIEAQSRQVAALRTQIDCDDLSGAGEHKIAVCERLYAIHRTQLNMQIEARQHAIASANEQADKILKIQADELNFLSASVDLLRREDSGKSNASKLQFRYPWEWSRVHAPLLSHRQECNPLARRLLGFYQP
ncbi:MAG: hypothetical protein MHM6MM_006333 [Cercozoa sp. M6MM]